MKTIEKSEEDRNWMRYMDAFLNYREWITYDCQSKSDNTNHEGKENVAKNRNMYSSILPYPVNLHTFIHIYTHTRRQTKTNPQTQTQISTYAYTTLTHKIHTPYIYMNKQIIIQRNILSY